MSSMFLSVSFFLFIVSFFSSLFCFGRVRFTQRESELHLYDAAAESKNDGMEEVEEESKSDRKQVCLCFVE